MQLALGAIHSKIVRGQRGQRWTCLFTPIFRFLTSSPRGRVAFSVGRDIRLLLSTLVGVLWSRTIVLGLLRLSLLRLGLWLLLPRGLRPGPIVTLGYFLWRLGLQGMRVTAILRSLREMAREEPGGGGNGDDSGGDQPIQALRSASGYPGTKARRGSRW